MPSPLIITIIFLVYAFLLVHIVRKTFFHIKLTKELEKELNEETKKLREINQLNKQNETLIQELTKETQILQERWRRLGETGKQIAKNLQQADKETKEEDNPKPNTSPNSLKN